jgi:hypothetical protein
MVFETWRNLFIVFVDFDRRIVFGKRWVSGGNKCPYSFSLTSIMVRVITDYHPFLINK